MQQTRFLPLLLSLALLPLAAPSLAQDTGQSPSTAADAQVPPGGARHHRPLHPSRQARNAHPAKPVAPVTPPPAPVPPPPPTMSVGTSVQLGFDADHVELSPDATAKLQAYAALVPHITGATLDVRAYAAPVANDPSIARRLSLSRALTVRQALLTAGIPSPQIFLRALGAPTGDAANTNAGPADRVDITLSALPPPAPVPAPASGVATQPRTTTTP